MDDEVFKMVNIEGQVGFRRAGFFFWFFFFGRGIYIYVFFFVSSNNRKQKYRAVSWQRNSGSGEENKIFRDGGEKKKSSKKHRSVNT